MTATPTTTDTATLEEMQAECERLARSVRNWEDDGLDALQQGRSDDARALFAVAADCKAQLNALDTRIRQARYAAIAAQVGVTVEQVAEVAAHLESLR